MQISDLENNELQKFIDRYKFAKELKNKTVLVTGTNGIMGSGLIKWMLKENQLNKTNTKIIASTRNPDKLPSYVEKTDSIEFCKFSEEREYCKGRRIDYVFHTAAPTSNRVFKAQPVESLKTIVDGTENILELSKEHGAMMLYFSSAEAYGAPTTNELITENFVGAVDSLNTRSCYTLGKKVAELMCVSYHEEYGVDVKILRPTVILGLLQPYDSVKVEAELLRCVMENKDFIMKSDGSTEKSVIYSLDAVSAAFTVLFNGAAGEAYNATNPATYCSVKQRANEVIAEFNPNVHLLFAEADTSVKEGYLPKYMLREDIAKIRRLGWEPLADMSYIYKVDIERFRQ